VNRPLIVGILGGLIVLAAIVLTFFIDREPDRPVGAVRLPAETAATDTGAPASTPEQPSAPAEKAGSQSAGDGTAASGSASPNAGEKAPAAAASQSPSFDIVRVNPQGDIVIAGRAPPNSTVTVRIGDRVIGTVQADSRGEWVLVPRTPLDAGSHELTIIAKLPDGSDVESVRTVVVVVPETGKDIAGRPASGTSSPLAVAVPKSGEGASVVLQTPGGGGTGTGLALNSIDYGNTGDKLGISGRAKPGSEVRIYLDNEFIGRATADERGVWSVVPDVPVKPGLYKMRVDEVDASGKVVARVELPFSRAEPFATLAGESVVFIQPGNTLWGLSRRVYGGGKRYTLIFEANKDQIRNPDLIYPGQVFILPQVN
jgi:hypothetical protein